MRNMPTGTAKFAGAAARRLSKTHNIHDSSKKQPLAEQNTKVRYKPLAPESIRYSGNVLTKG